MASVTNTQLAEDIKDILKDADLNLLSSKKVRKQLEEKYDTDYTERKKEIDELLMVAMEEHAQGNDDGGSDADDTDGADGANNEQGTSKQTNDDLDDDSDSDLEGVEDASPKKKVKIFKKKDPVVSENEEDEVIARQLQDEEDSGRRRTRGGGAKRRPLPKRKIKKDGTKGKSKNFKPVLLSPVLASLVGTDELPRNEVVKRIWDMAKERNLFDPKNRQFIKCDDELYSVFGRKRVRLFGMMKYLTSHIYTKDEVVEK